MVEFGGARTTIISSDFEIISRNTTREVKSEVCVCDDGVTKDTRVTLPEYRTLNDEPYVIDCSGADRITGRGIPRSNHGGVYASTTSR